MEGPITNLQA